MAKAYKIFISHCWDYDDVLQNLKNLLDSRGYFPAAYTQVEKSHPINSYYAPAIKAQITRRLEDSDIVLAIAGLYASHSDWMIWEMDKAKELGLNVVGVIPWGQERISQEVYQRSVKDVRWNTESIVAAIRQHAKQ